MLHIIYFIFGILLGLSISLYLYECNKEKLGNKLFTSILSKIKDDLYEEAYLKVYVKALREVREAFSKSQIQIEKIESQTKKSLSSKEKEDILDQCFQEIRNIS